MIKSFSTIYTKKNFQTSYSAVHEPTFEGAQINGKAP